MSVRHDPDGRRVGIVDEDPAVEQEASALSGEGRSGDKGLEEDDALRVKDGKGGVDRAE